MKYNGFDHRKSMLDPLNRLIQANHCLVFVNVGGIRRIGCCVKANYHTTVVKIMKGAKSYFTITRHNMKHNIQSYKIREHDNDEAIHSTIRDNIKAIQALEV